MSALKGEMDPPMPILVDSAITETLLPGTPWDDFTVLLERHVKVFVAILRPLVMRCI